MSIFSAFCSACYCVISAPGAWANELLIRATHSVMGRLTDFLADSGYVIVPSDAKGFY